MADSITPTLEPAFRTRLNPAPGFEVGKLFTGQSLTVVPITSGNISSVPGFGIPLDAEVVFGSDSVTLDPSGKHVRIHVEAVVKNKKDGALATYSYVGIVKVDPAYVLLVTGDPNAKTTEFGSALSHVTFTTGAESLKDLETSLFVGSARFVVQEGGGFYVDTRVSRVVG
ncbi:hypothetical protein F5X68DRAFT_226785 [Plectosphaerella plurivora]|uniref:Uncharacterized protein n=1 Tax=Plectosphaerella plurivora TaxID=936078 RepID=A0A9P8VKU5_9PEZI|nr:hypothetical protein F5X68DRAFT_226785 [Plectosphaerella plurivora]